MAQNVQGLNYKVCFTNIATTFPTQISYSIFGICAIYTPAGCCYVTTIFEVLSMYLNLLSGNFVCFKVGSHDPILVQLSFQIFLCMMKNVGVHTIQFSHPIIS